MNFRIFFLCVVIYSFNASAAERFQYQSYRDGVLRMLLVTPSTAGKVILRHDNKMSPLTGAVLEGLFTLKVDIPCQQLKVERNIYWYVPGRPPLSATIPAQKCGSRMSAVRIFTRNENCMVDTGGNTLWHTAKELTKWDHASVYHNIYGLLIANPHAFSGHDIHRLHQRILRCPDSQVINSLAIEHARQLFKESLAFHSIKRAAES